MRRAPLEILTKGWPVVLEMAHTVSGPPEVVWHLITDWEHQGDWMLEATDLVVTSDQTEGVGVTARATVTIAGITTMDEVRVVGWEPNKRLVIEHRGWVSGRGELYLTALDKGRTHVFWTEALWPPAGLAGALGLSFIGPVMARVFKRDLAVLGSLTGVRARALA